MLIIRQLKLPIWRHRSYNCNYYYFYAAGFAGRCFNLIRIPSTLTDRSGRFVCAGKHSPLNPDAATRWNALLVWAQSPDWPSVRGRHLRPREKGKFQSCDSYLAEVVAGHGPLHHILSIHLEDVVAAVRDERSVRQRHTLVAEGDGRVSLEGGEAPTRCTNVSIPYYVIWLIAGHSRHFDQIKLVQLFQSL